MDNRDDEAASCVPTTPTSHLEDPTLGPGTPKPDTWSAGASPDELRDIDVLPRPSTTPTRSPVHFVLGNFFFAMFSISLIIFFFFFAITWLTALQDVPSINDQMFSNMSGVSILGEALQLDLNARILSISWKVVGCGMETTSGNPFLGDVRLPARCGPFDRALDIYLNDPSKPVFSFIPHAKLTSKRSGIWDPPRFTVEHGLEKCGKRDPGEYLMVQFQRYCFNALIFAIDSTSNNSVHITTFGVLDTLDGFVVRSHDAADTSEFTCDSGNGLVVTEVQSHLLRGEITRSTIAKAFAVCLFLVNWTLTIGSVYITALVASRMLEANSMVAAFPLSAPLTIPTIRSLYIDYPPLGTSIDAVAFFVQISTVGLCSLVLLGILTSYRPSLSPLTGLPV